MQLNNGFLKPIDENIMAALQNLNLSETNSFNNE